MSSYFKAAKFVDSDEEEEERSEEEVSEEEEVQTKKKGGFFGKSKLVESEEEDEDEEEDEEEEAEQKEKENEAQTAQAEQEDKRKKWFLDGSDEEEESDYSDDEWLSSDEGSVASSVRAEVKSHRLKYLDELREVTEKIQDSIMDNNWKAVSDDFSEVGKVIEKLQKLDEYKGKKKVPNLYIRFLVYLDDKLEEAKSKKDDIKTADSKLITTFHREVKKTIKNYEDLMTACKAEPEAFQDTEDEAEEVPVDKKPQKKPTVPLTDVQKLMADLTSGTIEEKIAEIGRGKGYKGTNPKESLLQLKILLAHTPEVKTRIQLLLLIVLTHFDLPKGNSNYLSFDAWKNACLGLIRLIKLIEDHPELQVVESIDTLLGESAPSNNATSSEANQVHIKGNIASILERLYDEFITSLQYTDPHTQDYVKRLRDEYLLIEAAERVYSFYLKRNNKRNLARAAFKLFEHLYYRKQDDHEKILAAQRANALKALEEAHANWVEEEKQMLSESVTPTVDPFKVDSPDVIEANLPKVLSNLAIIIYEHGTDHAKIRTLLMQIYHRAVYGKFFEARNLLVTSKLQDNIHHYEIPTQILFNRAIAQIGICAFKNGLIQESHAALLELYGSQKQKELLAQGLTSSRYQQPATLQKKEQLEKIERSRLIPYHQHISIDLIEGVHLMCALLLEVPNMAMQSFSNVKPKVINKAFRRVLETFSRQHYVGPPENTKEHIYAAYNALSSGEWEEAFNILLCLEDIWSLIPDNESVKEMLKKKVKVAALKAYIFKYSRHYETISVQSLSTMFDLPKPTVYSIVNKMIIAEEFYAGLDQTNDTIVIYHSEPTPLQYLALQLTDKISALVEYNDKLYDAKQSNTAYVVMTDHKQQKRSKQKTTNKQGQGNQKGPRNTSGGNKGPNQKREKNTKHHKDKQQQQASSTPVTASVQ
nr:unnamed protein product [Naegleria fowleri]